MTISWYSFTITKNAETIFNGYFNVNNTTYLVQGFYDLALITGGNYTNVLLPINDAASWPQADNIYPITENGLNFYSTAIQNAYSLNQNHINFFYAAGDYGITTNTTADLNPSIIVVSSISGPPSPPQMVCFKEGTKILTNNGYIPIEHLRKGHLVKTLTNGYKSIDMIGKRDIYHYALQDRIKDQLYECSKINYVDIFEPLIITGCHSILVDEFLSEEQRQRVIEINGKIYVTDNKYRLPVCADPRATVYNTPGTYTIYHLALENDNYYMNYGIYANGLLVESCSKRYLKELSNMTLIE